MASLTLKTDSLIKEGLIAGQGDGLLYSSVELAVVVGQTLSHVGV